MCPVRLRPLSQGRRGQTLQRGRCQQRSGDLWDIQAGLKRAGERSAAERRVHGGAERQADQGRRPPLEDERGRQARPREGWRSPPPSERCGPSPASLLLPVPTLSPLASSPGGRLQGPPEEAGPGQGGGPAPQSDGRTQLCADQERPQLRREVWGEGGEVG